MSACAHDHDVPGVAARRGRARPSLAARGLLVMIRLYQGARAGRPSPCRFIPSCSSYGHEAIETHGALRGSRLTVARILRCRPGGPSGVDLVPPPSVKG